jgi:hypothetical protein
MVKLEKAKLDELKTAHPEGIFEGTISFTDADDNPHSVEFVFRKPVMADMEAYSKGVQRSPIIANLNLVQSLILYPEPGPIINEIRDYPAAYAKFVDDVASPFFGANVTTGKKAL